MLFAQLGYSCREIEIQGHIGDLTFSKRLNDSSWRVQSIQADGHELAKCCEILGRALPPRFVYTFFGDNAKEIARNWV